MFTGIIAGLGIIRAIQRFGHEIRLVITPQFVMDKITDGESIAIDGVCLSVEAHDADSFHVYASAETMSRTNFHNLRNGMEVNLERAVAAGERLGGHLVTGHVDCVALVKNISSVGQSLRIRVSFPAEYAPQIIPKGSIALDGISLTVNECGKDFLEVNIIPDSLKRTNIRTWRQSTEINMETDLIGKYVLNAFSILGNNSGIKRPSESISLEMLARNGFI